MANNTISQVEINNETYDLMDANILNRIYPVGAIYMSVDSTSPASFIGGTWERIQDRFLLAAGSTYGAGTTGGEASHTLTPAETAIKSHTHTLNNHTHTTTIGSHSHTVTTSARNLTNPFNLSNATGLCWVNRHFVSQSGTNGSSIGAVNAQSTKSSDITVPIPALSGSAAGTDLGSKTSGGPSNNSTSGLTEANGSAHNNMPPYLAVYIWKRTA